MAKTAKGKSQPGFSSGEGEPGEIQDSQPTQEQIALRAYQLYLERGGDGGNSEDDWLQAERELSQAAE